MKNREILGGKNIVLGVCSSIAVYKSCELVSELVKSGASVRVVMTAAAAKLISPRSFNEQKEEAYECGVPTRGRSWMQFRVGYYLFAILFLMFDVETMFLFPWAVVMRTLGPAGLVSVLFFLFILVLGLGYAWRKGALKWQ